MRIDLHLGRLAQKLTELNLGDPVYQCFWKIQIFAVPPLAQPGIYPVRGLAALRHAKRALW